MGKHRKKLIKNAAVFDGHSGSLTYGQKLIIADDLVTEITADEVSEENFDEVFDAAGMVAMPGMIDAHVHMGCLWVKGEFPVDYATVLTVAKCRDALMSGFTTFRDAGSVSEGLKLAFDEEVLPGPRIYPCGAYISQTCGHGDSMEAHAYRDIQYRHPARTVLADGVPEIIRAVREQFYRGASHIKLMAGGGCMSACDPIETVQFTAEEMKAACDVAADYGTYVMAHLYTPKSILRALGAGVKSLEHAHLINEEAAKRVAAAGAFLNPMPQFKKYEDMIGADNMPPKDEMICRAEERATEILNRHEDIRLLFGTDMMIMGPDYQVEQSEDIRYYEKRFGTMRTLRALTGNANEVFGLTTYQNPYPKGKIGVLEAGSYADLLLVDEDPTKSAAILADTDHLRLIMKGGTVYKNTLCQGLA